MHEETDDTGKQDTLHHCIREVWEMFRGDWDRTEWWFESYNRILGCTPEDMLRAGKANELLEFILMLRETRGR